MTLVDNSVPVDDQAPEKLDPETEALPAPRSIKISRQFVIKGSEALLAFLNQSKTTSKKSKPDLLSLDEPLPIHVNFSVWATPPSNKIVPVKIKSLPYDPHGGVSKRVCLIVPNIEKKTQADIHDFYKKIAASINLPHVFEVITMKELKQLSSTFDEKRKLLRSYDIFLADFQISKLLMRFLGSVFTRANKFPIATTLSNRHQLKSVLTGTSCHLHSNGNNYSFLIGHSKMTTRQLSDNIVEAFIQMSKVIKQGWRVVRSAGIKSKDTVYIPVYDSTFSSSFLELKKLYNMSKFESYDCYFKDSVTDQKLNKKERKKKQLRERKYDLVIDGESSIKDDLVEPKSDGAEKKTLTFKQKENKSSLRSTTDVAMQKTKSREQKKKAPAKEIGFSGYDRALLAGELPEERATKKSGSKSNKKKAKNPELFSGLEQYALEGGSDNEAVQQKRADRKRKRTDQTDGVVSPLPFMEDDDCAFDVEQNEAKDTVQAIPSSAAKKRRTRLSVAAPETPLRRSRRINSNN